MKRSLIVFSGGLAVALAGACGSTEPEQATDLDESGGSGSEQEVKFPDERAAERAPQATETVQRGERLLQQGKADKARVLFEQAIEEDPQDVRAHLDLGLALEMQGDVEGAEEAYRAALDIDPDFPEALNNLGLLLRRQDRHDEAIRMFKKAIEARSGFADAHFNLALTFEETGQLEQAAEAYRKTKRLAPGHAVARSNYGLVLLELGRAEQAAAELREALPKAKGNAAALQAIANGLRRTRQFDLAVRAMRMAVDAREGGPTPAMLSELALAQRAAGDRDGAEATLEKALERDPEYATAYFLLGSMRAGRGAYEKAIAHFERYLELAPQGRHAAKARQRLEAAREAAGGSE